MSDVKAYAVASGRTVTSVLEEALRRLLAEHAAAARPVPTLPVSRHGGGVLPGVDLDNSAALADLMDLESASPGFGRGGPESC